MPLDKDNIWQPSDAYIENAHVTALMKRLGIADFDALHDFSLSEPETYWRTVVDMCGVRWSRDYDTVCDISRGAPFPSWFVGGEMNWVDTILDNDAARERVAVVAERETGDVRQLTYAELADEVRGFAAGLKAIGIGRGDRVGLLMENGIEATISLLAISYIGAIVVPLFSGFGSDAVVSRLSQCGVRTLVTTTGFQRRGRFISTQGTMSEVRAQLPDLDTIILKRSPEDPAPWGRDGSDGVLDWHALARRRRRPGLPSGCRPTTRSWSSTRPAPPANRRARCMSTAASRSRWCTIPRFTSTSAPAT